MSLLPSRPRLGSLVPPVSPRNIRASGHTTLPVPSNRYTRPGPAVFDNNFHLVPPRDIRAPDDSPAKPVTGSDVPDIFRAPEQRNFFSKRAAQRSKPGTTTSLSLSLSLSLSVSRGILRLSRATVRSRLNGYIVPESVQDGHLPFAPSDKPVLRRRSSSLPTIYGNETNCCDSLRLSVRDKYAEVCLLSLSFFFFRFLSYKKQIQPAKNIRLV